MSLWAAASGMRVHALEPLQRNHALLVASVAANAARGRTLDVTAHRAAAGGRPSAPSAFTPQAGNMAATSPAIRGHVPAPAELGSLAPTVRVRDVVPPGEAELAVLNCQGCELGVLEDLLAARAVANFLLITYVRGTGGPLLADTREAFRRLLAEGYCLYDPHPPRPARIPDVWERADAVRSGALQRRPYPNVVASRTCR
jgi:FkbM family methyltransferase